MMVAGGAEFSHLFYTEFGRPGDGVRFVMFNISCNRVIHQKLVKDTKRLVVRSELKVHDLS